MYSQWNPPYYEIAIEEKKSYSYSFKKKEKGTHMLTSAKFLEWGDVHSLCECSTQTILA